MKNLPLATGLGIVLILVGTGLVLTPGTAPPPWQVMKSQGRAYQIGGAVLVRGDNLNPGDSIRALDELVLSPGSGTAVQLHRTAVLRVGPYAGSGQPGELLHVTGSGRARAGSRSLRHRFPAGGPGEKNARVTLVHTSGRLGWNLQRSQVLRDDSTRGYWRTQGDTRSLDRPPGDWRVLSIPGGIAADPETIKNRRSSSSGGILMAPGRVLDRLVREVEAGHTVPRTLREAMGFWVRDRWGQVYLYQPGNSFLQLRSSGPDEVLFTGDDRTYRRSFFPTGDPPKDPRTISGKNQVDPDGQGR